MPKKLNPEETFKILENLPKDLKEAMFAPDTADHIANICEKFEVPGEKFSLVASAVGDVLSRMTPVEEFPKVLEKEIGLRKEQAENVAQEIDFRIFSQVRESLATAVPKAVPEAKISTVAPAAEQPPKKPSGPDIYREPAA